MEKMLITGRLWMMDGAAIADELQAALDYFYLREGEAFTKILLRPDEAEALGSSEFHGLPVEGSTDVPAKHAWFVMKGREE